MLRISVLFFLASLLCSCGKSKEAPKEKILQSQREQLQKVKELDASAQKTEKMHREEIEKQINGEMSNK